MIDGSVGKRDCHLLSINMGKIVFVLYFGLSSITTKFHASIQISIIYKSAPFTQQTPQPNTSISYPYRHMQNPPPSPQQTPQLRPLSQPPNTQQPPSQMFEIDETPTKLLLKTKLSQNSIRLQNQKLQEMKFGSLGDKGKYNSVKLSYNHQQRVVSIKIDKKYYFNVLNLKKYEVLIFVRTYQIIFEQFITLMNQIKYKLTEQADCKLIMADVFSLTVYRDFYVRVYNNSSNGNGNGNGDGLENVGSGGSGRKQKEKDKNKGGVQIKRIFVRISPFLFRRNPYIRNKQCQQFFAVVIQDIDDPTHSNPNQMRNQSNQSHTDIQIPTDQQFYNSPRLNFIDDMYANQSFARRFAPRFYTFYQANSLLTQNVPLNHKYVKQFYQKCASKCIMSAIRLKKISYHFKINSLEKEKEKNLKMALYFYCIEQDKQFHSKNASIATSATNPNVIPFTPPTPKQPQFIMEIVVDPEISQKFSNIQNLNDIFLKHLSQSLNNAHDAQFVQIFNYQNSRGIRFINQIGFCRVLGEFCFFMDRLIIRNSPVKILGDNTPLNNNFKDVEMCLRLPLSQSYNFKKYICNYCIQIKSTYNYLQNNPNIHLNLNINLNMNSANSNNASILKQQIKAPYENTLSKITMIRKKIAKDGSSTQNLEFGCNLEQLKGMTIYTNQLLKKWNAYDCYHDINNFISNYLNIVVDKNKQKQKNLFKNTDHWKKIIDQLSALTQSLTKSLITQDTTLLLHILRTYEDFTRNDELTRQQIFEQEQVMLMTFKYMKISQAGWIELMPSCVYFFEMHRSFTYLYCQGEEKEVIPIKSSKQQIQKIFRGYLKKTQKFKCQLPPMCYGS